MKSLILFSLKRKLFNKVMVLMMVIVFVLGGAVFFADKMVDIFFPNLFSQVKVYMDETMASYFDFEDTKYVITSKKEANVSILKNEVGYLIEVDQSVSEADLVVSQSWISYYHQIHESQYISQEITNVVDYLLHPNVEVVTSKLNNAENGFIIITMIYFLMLGFSSTVANEVVSEKTTNMLEMMLTSITYKEHYITKLIIGWITVLSQAIIWIGVILWWVIVRLIVDQGKGLYELLYRLKWISTPYTSFFEHLSSINISLSFVMMISISLLFLLVGILFIQLLLLLVSIRIENIEESASVQAPFYLIMLGLYYGTLALNTYNHMQLGVGKLLSFLPGLSMLFIPIRLLYYEVSTLEILLSFLIAIGSLSYGYYRGLCYYKQIITGVK